MLRRDRRGRDREGNHGRAGACRGWTEAGPAAPGSGCARALAADRSGAVAVIFGFALIPLIGIMGAAVDYSRASLGRANLQTAVDSAGLAVAMTRFGVLGTEPLQVSASNEISWDIGQVEIALRGPSRGMEPILRLTKEFQTVRDKITAMTATGQTNVPMGLVRDRHLLAPRAPFADGVPYDTDNVTKHAILMTDGDNTFNRLDNNYSDYAGLGDVWQRRLGNSPDNPSASTRTDLMDGRLETLCNNLTRKPAAGDPKTSAAPDIQVYAIRVEVTSGTSDVLKNCASATSMDYDVADSDNLTTVFDRIAEEITQLRLSK